MRTGVQYVLVGVMLMITLVSVFTPEVHFLKVFSQYTLIIMLGFLTLGFVSFVWGQERMMMWSFLCCAALCLHLKESSNQQLRLPAVTASPSLRVSHISLSNVDSDYNTVIDYLLSLDTDLLSFQELTPDWNQHLIDRLSPRFTFVRTLTRLDQYGMGFFSKYPFQSFDTLYFGEIPSLAGTILMGDRKPVHIISAQGIPPVSQSAFTSIMQHFNFINAYISKLDGNVMVMGDFHLPPWSTEVQRFRTNSNLQDGRRDIYTRHLDGSMSLPRIPVEHILFSEGLECTLFAEIGNAVVGRLGITGTYQLHDEEMAQ